MKRIMNAPGWLRMLAWGLLLAAAFWVGTCIPADAQQGDTYEVALTYYTPAVCWDPACTTYSGWSAYELYPLTAACGWGLAEGSLLALPDDRILQCLDRGSGLASYHVDIFVLSRAEGRRDVAQRYGERTTVRLLRAGWGDF